MRSCHYNYHSVPKKIQYVYSYPITTTYIYIIVMIQTTIYTSSNCFPFPFLFFIYLSYCIIYVSLLYFPSHSLYVQLTIGCGLDEAEADKLKMMLSFLHLILKLVCCVLPVDAAFYKICLKFSS